MSIQSDSVPAEGLSNELPDNTKHKKLNDSMDITIAGVTYHVVSSFTGTRTLGELLDILTLEKMERAMRDTCFKV